MIRIDVKIVFDGQTILDIPKQLKNKPFKLIVNGNPYEKNRQFVMIDTSKIELMPTVDPFKEKDKIFFTDY